jgi:hypothetical protein
VARLEGIEIKMGRLLKMQPSLIHVAANKDIVYTPDWLAFDIVKHFSPAGVCLDPCVGGGAFLKHLPEGSDWCEIEKGKDFYAWTEKVNWIVSNPPYSHLLAWIRHSFKVAENIVYLMPVHRVFSSSEFLFDLLKWGGVAEIRLYGTGTVAGFAFGNALGAVHYKAGYRGSTVWSRYQNQ